MWTVEDVSYCKESRHFEVILSSGIATWCEVANVGGLRDGDGKKIKRLVAIC